MAMSSNSEIRSLERELSHLLNKQLQHICASNGLRTSGVKAELQNRIKTALIENYHSDRASFQHLETAIKNARSGSSSRMTQSSSTQPEVSTQQSRSNYQYAGQATGGQMPRTAYGHDQGYGTYGTTNGTSTYRPSNSSPQLQFKHSPFYYQECLVGDVQTCEVMTQHRNTVQFTLKVSEHPTLVRCANDKSYRVMVFCAGDKEGLQDIAFPQQAELKVNGGDIRANLRGLKGKPGSTRPVDITDSLRLKQLNYVNNVEFTYALTQKRYYLALYLCKAIPVTDLVSKIRSRKIRKETVLKDFSRAANDPDVVATSENLSLKCPLSYTRLRTPCRSVTCKHVSCFDATSYLQLQEQGPQWICPVCSKSAPFENLAIDEYVKDILDNTSDTVDQVTIEPDGVWHKEGARATPSPVRTHTTNVKYEDDDDDISILNAPPAGTNGSSRIFSTPNRSLLHASTSNGASSMASREPSSAPRSAGTKRTAEVIDLTLSSDEDDEPVVRPAKRPNLGLSHSGLNSGNDLTYPPYGY